MAQPTDIGDLAALSARPISPLNERKTSAEGRDSLPAAPYGINGELAKSTASTTTTSTLVDHGLPSPPYSPTSTPDAAAASPSPAASSSILKLPSLPPPPVPAMKRESISLVTTHSHRHSTWAGTFHSRPSLWTQPRSTEEVQRIVRQARSARRRLVAVGSGHSPSDITCSSGWMINLDKMDGVLEVRKYDHPAPAAAVAAAPAAVADAAAADADATPIDPPTSNDSYVTISPASSPKLTAVHRRYGGRALVQAGISLKKLNDAMSLEGLTLPNLGSINIQSLAGAIATATHGSSMNHGILSSNVRGLRIVLPSGEARWCSASPDEYPDLFRAALVSLGALGVVTEIEIELAHASNIEWETRLLALPDALGKWERGLWDQGEFVRCWWMPYTKRLVVWAGSKTDEACRRPERGSSYAGWLGYHAYQGMLWLANYFPSLVPRVERLVMGLEHGSATGRSNGGVEEQRAALLMDCLYSQFVNEWAIPLRRGPEAIRRLEAWLLGPEHGNGSGIPYSNRGVYAHAPIEVRVSDGTIEGADLGQPRAFLDHTCADGPTLYLNATLYRPYGSAPPWKDRYYEGFEWLMKEMGGRPHWAKNFGSVERADLQAMYGLDFDKWNVVRDLVDPDGMFVGAWHRRTLLGSRPTLPTEERRAGQTKRWGGGMSWTGEQAHGQ